MSKPATRTRNRARPAAKKSKFPPLSSKVKGTSLHRMVQRDPSAIRGWLSERHDSLVAFLKNAPWDRESVLLLIDENSNQAKHLRRLDARYKIDTGASAGVPRKGPLFAWIPPAEANRLIGTMDDLSKSADASAGCIVGETPDFQRTPKGFWMLVGSDTTLAAFDVPIDGSFGFYPNSQIDAVAFLTPDGEEEYGLTPLGMLQMLWNSTDKDLAEMSADVQKDVRIFQSRVKAAYDAACIANGSPPNIDDILRKVGRVDLLSKAIDRSCFGGVEDKNDVLKQMLLGEMN